MTISQVSNMNKAPYTDKTKVNITEREIEVLELLCKGFTCNEVAAFLFLSSETIKSHRRNLYLKLGVKTGVQLGAVGYSYLSQ